MKQTIEIEVPEGTIWKDGKVVFEDIEKLLKTWEEFYKIHNNIAGDAWIGDNSGIVEQTKERKRMPD